MHGHSLLQGLPHQLLSTSRLFLRGIRTSHLICVRRVL
jgi:hypothetical protein